MPLSDAVITKKVGQLRNSEGKIYAPLKYFRGLETLKGVETRYKRCSGKIINFSRRTRDRRQRLPPTPRNLGRCIRELNPSLKLLRLLRFLWGLWRLCSTGDSLRGEPGHRPGASPQAWGYARVHSFATKGKTYYTADKDLRWLSGNEYYLFLRLYLAWNFLNNSASPPCLGEVWELPFK